MEKNLKMEIWLFLITRQQLMVKILKEGREKNTQVILGKDLFIKDFDKQLLGANKNEDKVANVTLPENYPQKEYSNKKARFVCSIKNIKKPEPTKINDDFAKTLGAKDLKDLKIIVSKQISRSIQKHFRYNYQERYS